MVARTSTWASSSVDATGFEDLLRKYHRQTFNFALRLTGNRSEAEDLVQEAHLRAFRFYHRYDPTMPFQNWLYRIIGNTFIDQVRKSKRWAAISLDQTTRTGATWELADNIPNAEASLMNAAFGDQVQRALVTMNPEFRTAVILSDVEGLSYEEIAEVMTCSVGTVRSRIHRGRIQLKSALLRVSPDYYKEAAGEL